MERKARIKYLSPTLRGADLILHVDDPEGIDELTDKELRLKLSPWRNKRSLNANAYFHVLVDKLAETTGMSKPRMKNLLLFRYGQRARDKAGNLAIIKSNADESELIEREDFHCWPIHEAPDGTPMYVILGHSRFYDTKEMSALIDGTVEEAKQMGIDVLTPTEISEIMQKWGIDIGKHNSDA